MHHVALLVDGFGVKRDAVRPVLEDEHAGVEGGDACCGHILDKIDGLVGGGVGVEVSAILHANRLQVFLQGVVLEMVGAVEGHVLEQVGKTSLVVVFLHRPHFLCDIETGHMLRIVVVADVVGQSIVELALAKVGVNGDGRVLGLRLCHKEQQQ